MQSKRPASPPKPPVLALPPHLTQAITNLGAAITDLANIPSTSSTSSPQSDQPSIPPPVSDQRTTLTIRQSLPSLLNLPAHPVQLFRVRDEHRHKRYKVLYPGRLPTGPDALVVDEAGRPVWSVRPGRLPATKIFLKPGSDYHIVIVRRHWVAYLNRLVEAVAFRNGKERVVFVVKGDAVGRRFQMYAGKELIGQMQRRTQILEREAPLQMWGNEKINLHTNCASWSVCLEAGVDSALVTAVVAVLERWTVEAKVVDKAAAERGKGKGSWRESKERLPTSK